MRSIKIVHISDTHTQHAKLKLPPGDWLVHSGDATYNGELGPTKNFLAWLNVQPYKRILYTEGNHDGVGERHPALMQELLKEFPNVIYLENETKIIDGIKVFGSPVTVPFCSWRWNWKDAKRKELWKTIEPGTKIVITHGPPKGILDKVIEREPWMNPLTLGEEYRDVVRHTGCPFLLRELKKIKPACHFFGHIHCDRGMQIVDGVTYSNGSVLDDHYQAVYEPNVIEFFPDHD